MRISRSILIVAASYLAIVLALWLPFNLRGGLPYETGFIYTSEISKWWNGFLHGADHMRIYAAIFYQVAYLMGSLTGFAGSFVPFQIVYAALWWARGFLVFLIGRRLAPGYDLFWYLAGALALIHSSDETTAWAGMLNAAYTLWMPLAFYMLVLAFQQADRSRAAIALVLAVFFEHLSLWSYEGQLPILIVAPLLPLAMYRRPSNSRLVIAAAWYAVPIIYLAATLRRYAQPGTHSYQQSILRKTWSLSSILSDWWFNISASLRFWAWPGPQQFHAGAHDWMLPAACAVVVFLAGTLLLAWSDSWIPQRRALGTWMLAGLILVAISFPAYLILDSARTLWRTQILSSFGAALVLSAAIGICASYVPKRWLQISAMALLGAAVVSYGSYSTLKKAAYHRWLWDRHRAAMAQVLDAAPRLKPGTLVILTGVPKDADPFSGDNMWFDMALRLAYPGTAVAGVYFYRDGAEAPGAGLAISPAGDWRLRGDQLLAKGDVDALLVFEYHEQNVLSVARRLPGVLHIDENAARSYHPEARVESGSPSQRAVRRYAASIPADYLPVTNGSANATYAPRMFVCVAFVSPSCADAQNTTNWRPLTS